jgi:hypothetical protein
VSSLQAYRQALGAFVARLPRHLDVNGAQGPAARAASTLRDA